MLEDAVYYSRREAEERGLAEQSADPKVRDVHLMLADKYLQLAHRAMAAMPGPLGEPVADQAAAIDRRHARRFR